jgi:hypothetical protein
MLLLEGNPFPMLDTWYISLMSSFMLASLHEGSAGCILVIPSFMVMVGKGFAQVGSGRTGSSAGFGTKLSPSSTVAVLFFLLPLFFFFFFFFESLVEEPFLEGNRGPAASDSHTNSTPAAESKKQLRGCCQLKH